MARAQVAATHPSANRMAASTNGDLGATSYTKPATRAPAIIPSDLMDWNRPETRPWPSGSPSTTRACMSGVYMELKT